MDDTVDKLTAFLAKRDGVDKLVKTIQYVSKLVHWHAVAAHPDVAKRAKQAELAAGLSRKAFRTGRFLSGFNTLRRSPGQGRTLLQLLAVLSNAGEMVYFFFDNLLWLSRVGVLDPEMATRLSFVSAFGEGFGYIFFIILDLVAIGEGLKEERKLVCSEEKDVDSAKKKKEMLRVERAMKVAAVAANVADLVIAVSDVEPNRFCSHAVSLGVSGLVSALAGWYRNWPS